MLVVVVEEEGKRKSITVRLLGPQSASENTLINHFKNLNVKKRLQRVHVGTAAPVRQPPGTGIVRPGQLSSEMGRRRGREG